MKRFIRNISFVLAVLLLTSCGIFREATVKENSTVTSENVIIGTSAESTAVSSAETSDVTETETTVPPVLPDEPDPSVFYSLESRLQSPPEEEAKVSFYYEDITSGISYSYNGDVMMWNASVMKLPIVMSILYKAETEDVGLDDVYVYTEEDFREGSGEIINKPVGTEYTYIELLEYMLRYSDNVALNQVRRKYGQYCHYDYVKSIGADGFAYGSGWSSTAKECGLVLRSTYEYLEGGYKYSERIKRVLQNSLHTVMLTPGLSGKPIARKYGWDTQGYNDIGIVYDEHPYVIVFMSDMVSGSGTVNTYISGLAREADRIHEEIWGTVQ